MCVWFMLYFYTCVARFVLYFSICLGFFFHLMTWQVNAHHGGDRATSATSRSVVVTDAEGGGRLNPCQAGGGRLNPLELRSHTVDANTP